MKTLIIKSFASGISLLGMALLAGCASSNPRSSIDAMGRMVEDRTGQKVQWVGDDEGVAQIDQTVSALLRTNLTAQGALAIALLNNRALQIEFEEIGISRAQMAQASRLRNPTISGSWRFPDRPVGPVDMQYGMINDFLDLITLPARKRIAAQNLEIAKQRIAHDMVVFAEEADTAYYTYQARRQAAGRLAVVVDVNEAAADVAQRQFNAGNINSLTLQTEQFAQDESRINLAKIKAQARADRERLNRLMGLSGNQAAANIDADLPSLPEKDPSLEDVESIALSRRLDLAAAQGEVQLAAYAIKLKRSTRYIPGVNVGINAERDVDRAWVIGPTLDLEIPLFDQGQPEMAKLAARYRQARRHFEALSVDIRSEAREARDALLAAREAASLHQQVLLPRTQKILSESLLHYNGMQLGNYELLLAKQREAAEEQSAIEAQRDYWIARAKLRTAMGGDAPQTAHP